MANKKVSQLTSKPAVNLTDLFLIADPTSGQAFKTTISDLGTAIGSGVSSVNTLVGAVVLDTDDIQELASPTNRWFTDTRARAAVSASSPLAYNSGTGVFSISQATSSQNGFLSSADWTTFNAKQAALSGTGFVKISGTTISYDNSTYLTTSAAASTYLALAGGTLTGALNGTSANFSGDLTLTGTNPRFYLTDSDNNPDYFISNTDGTFTVYDVTNSTSRFTIGTTGNATFTNAITGGGSITGESIYSNGIVSVGTGLTVGTTISATGSITGASIIRSGGTSSQFLKADGSVDSSVYALDSAVVKLTGNQTIAGVKTFTSGIVADVTTGGTQGFASTNSSTSGSSIFLQNNSTSVGNAIGINNTSTADGISIGNDTSGRAIYISNATASGSGKGISIDNYNSGIGIEVGSDSTADAIKVLHLSGRAFNIQSSGGGYGVIINNTTASTSAPFTIQKQGANRITFTDAGAGTFVSTISAAGATLTGALSGTSATFSSTLSATKGTFIGTTSEPIRIERIVSGTTVGRYSLAISGAGNFSLYDATADSDRLTIASTGAATFSSSVTATSIGINTTTINAKLEVASGSSGSTEIQRWSYNAGDANFSLRLKQDVSSGLVKHIFDLVNNGTTYANNLVLTNGNVGIGTTAPSTRFVVSNAGAGGIEMQGNSSVSGGAFLQTYNRSTNAFFDFDIVANNMIFRTGQSYAEAMRITSAGFLGLNQTSPSQRLDVSGAIRSGVGVSNGASIAKATGRTLYKVMVSSNYDAGGAVRGGEWNVLLSNEGDAVTNTTQIYVYNNQTATFSVSGGNLIINGLNSGNTICAVYTD